MSAVTPLSGRPVADASLAALVAHLPGSYWVGEGEGPPVPDQACPAVVLYVSPGLVGGYPFKPGQYLTQTASIVGIGKTAEQAQKAAEAGQAVLLSGVVVVEGRRVIFTADDVQPSYPQRDTSLIPMLFTQTLVLNVRN